MLPAPLTLFFWLLPATMGAGAQAPDHLGAFRCTYYWVAEESRHQGTRSVRLLDPSGAELARVSRSFARALRMEGTGRLRDGRVLNWAGSGRYVVTGSRWGFGVREEWPLVPFRTVAVDPSVVPYGTWLYIDAACGLPLPDGTLHDGLFVAHDTGSAIKGRHLDLFVGLPEGAEALQRALSGSVSVQRLD